MSKKHLSPQVIDRESAAYPERLKFLLGSRAPERLYVLGNASLFERRAISFCGARDASEKGVMAAAVCARTASQHEYVVASGNARGVDRATHREALLQGGETILVLAEGIDRFRIPAELRDVWDWDRVLVLSQFDPVAIWRSYQAMARNSVIMGLSCAMIVVEAGENGGTRAAGEEALKLRVPLFAVDYGFDETIAPGNKMLIRRGATPLKKSRETGQPNLKGLLAAAHTFCSTCDERAKQLEGRDQMRLF
ncbi:MAG TPA: DNA-processing protein DprA [Allosphingosinicella sp.]|nr:DNA-processing protein DprA [Allosphingosinicella sp.]